MKQIRELMQNYSIKHPIDHKAFASNLWKILNDDNLDVLRVAMSVGLENLPIVFGGGGSRMLGSPRPL